MYKRYDKLIKKSTLQPAHNMTVTIIYLYFVRYEIESIPSGYLSGGGTLI